MEIDRHTGKVEWRIPLTDIDFDQIDLSEYVEAMALANGDPQKIGKSNLYYRAAGRLFADL